MKQFRRLETEFVLLFHFSFISTVRAPLWRPWLPDPSAAHS